MNCECTIESASNGRVMFTHVCDLHFDYGIFFTTIIFQKLLGEGTIREYKGLSPSELKTKLAEAGVKKWPSR